MNSNEDYMISLKNLAKKIIDGIITEENDQRALNEFENASLGLDAEESQEFDDFMTYHRQKKERMDFTKKWYPHKS